MGLDRKQTSPTESGCMRNAVWEHSGADILNLRPAGQVGLFVARVKCMKSG